MWNKKKAPRPKRRNDDIQPIDEMIVSTVIFICVMGAIFLILLYGGMG